MREQHMPSHGKNVSSVMTILQGGHGGTTAAEARTNLQVFGTSEVDVANGIASLKDGKVPPTLVDTSLLSLPGIYGPLVVQISREVLYGISNYDAFTKYTASARLGSVRVTDKGLVYHAPSEPGLEVITFEGREFPISVTHSIASIRPVSAFITSADADNYQVQFELEGNLDSSINLTHTLTVTSRTGLSGVRSVVQAYVPLVTFTIPKNWIPLSGAVLKLDLISGSTTLGSGSFDMGRPDSSSSQKWIQRIVASQGNVTYPSCTSVRFHLNGQFLTVSPVFYQKVWTPYVQNPKIYKKGTFGDFRLAATLPLSQRGYGYRSLSFSPSGQYLFAMDSPYVDPSAGRGDIFGVADNGATLALTYRYSITGVNASDPGGNNFVFGTSHLSCVHKWLKGATDRLFYGDDSRYVNFNSGQYSIPIYTIDDIGASAATNRVRYNAYAHTGYLQNGSGLSNVSGNTTDLFDFNIAENADSTRLAVLGVGARVPDAPGITQPTLTNGVGVGALQVLNNANGVLTGLAVKWRSGANRFGDGVVFVGNDLVVPVAAVALAGAGTVAENNLATYSFAHPYSFSNPRFVVYRASDTYTTIYETADLATLSGGRMSNNSWTRIIKANPGGDGFYAAHYDATNAKFFLVRYTFASGLLTASGVDILLTIDYATAEAQALFGDGTVSTILSCDVDITNRLFAFCWMNRLVVDIFKY